MTSPRHPGGVRRRARAAALRIPVRYDTAERTQLRKASPGPRQTLRSPTRRSGATCSCGVQGASRYRLPPSLAVKFPVSRGASNPAPAPRSLSRSRRYRPLVARRAGQQRPCPGPEHVPRCACARSLAARRRAQQDAIGPGLTLTMCPVVAMTIGGASTPAVNSGSPRHRPNSRAVKACITGPKRKKGPSRPCTLPFPARTCLKT